MGAVVLMFFFLGCSPTCEQTCTKLAKCDGLIASEEVCVNSCNAQEQLYESWEEDYNQNLKDESSQESQEQGASEQVVVTQSTDSTEDRDESPHYSEQFDLWKMCVSENTCSAIESGACYDPEIYPY